MSDTPKNPAASAALNPWQPMTRPIDLAHLGKLAEELNEAGAAVSRCIIQGIDECEPVTGKPNKQWLEDELADVHANIQLVAAHFKLDRERMRERSGRKVDHLRAWHAMLDEKPVTRDGRWRSWKFVHNALIHPFLALPWEPRWAQRAHDETAKRCVGGG